MTGGDNKQVSPTVDIRHLGMSQAAGSGDQWKLLAAGRHDDVTNPLRLSLALPAQPNIKPGPDRLSLPGLKRVTSTPFGVWKTRGKTPP